MTRRGLGAVLGLTLAIGCGGPGSVNDRPELTLSHTALELGRVVVGDSIAGYLLASNTGSAALTIRAPSIVGADASAFSLPAGFSGGTLEPDGELTFEVTFTPSAVGAANATLELPHDALNTHSPIAIPLSGEGL